MIFNKEIIPQSSKADWVRYFREDLEYFIRKSMVVLDMTEDKRGDEENDNKFLELMCENVIGIKDSYERSYNNFHENLIKD